MHVKMLLVLFSFAASVHGSHIFCHFVIKSGEKKALSVHQEIRRAVEVAGEQTIFILHTVKKRKT